MLPSEQPAEHVGGRFDSSLLDLTLKISWSKRTPFSLRFTPSMNEPWSPAVASVFLPRQDA